MSNLNEKIMERLLAKHGPERDGQDEEPERDDPKLVAAEEFLAAVSRRDAQGLLDAFQVLQDACAGHDDEPSDGGVYANRGGRYRR